MHESTIKKPKYWVPAAGKRGMTELHDAAYHNDPERVGELLATGCPVDPRDDAGWTPMMWAVDMAQAWGEPGRVVDMLLRAGASPDAANVGGETVFMRACERHNVAVFEALAAAGADPNLRSPRSTALHDAAAAGFDHAVVRLLELGADPLATDGSGRIAEETARRNEWQSIVDILVAWRERGEGHSGENVAP